MRLMIDKAASIGSRYGCSGAAASSAPTISAIVGVGAAASIGFSNATARARCDGRPGWLS